MLARSQRFYYRPEFLHIMFSVDDFFFVGEFFLERLLSLVSLLACLL